ncbi:MAG: T9SS type A sorting domain-containing protein [Saprospiraceae bacterium]|nr:T9SS type A sorting domain-containing protein [Saprospiraceae bacterium]
MILDNGLLYYQNFFWYKSDRISFVEVRNASLYDTYIFSFDVEPKKITPSGRVEQLIGVMEEDEFSVLIYKDVMSKLIFEKYTYPTDEFEVMNEMQSQINSSIGNFVQKLKDNYHLLSINDGEHGREPYLFNTNNGELTLLEDIRTGFSSSYMQDFTKDPQTSNIYFSAIKTEGDRQLFKLDVELLNIEKVIVDSKSDVRAYPNPTPGIIFLSIDYNVSLTDLNGRVITKKLNTNTIDISSQASSMYFLLLADKNEQLIKAIKVVKE